MSFKLKFLNTGSSDYIYEEWQVANKSWLQIFHQKFKDYIAYLIYDKNYKWLQFLISILCEIEMGILYLKDRELQDALSGCNIGIKKDENGNWITKANRNIPQNTFYCQGCPYGVYISKIARFFYGLHCDGYCYYKGRGDFSFLNPTDLLWDGCKECGINEDIEEEI